MGPERALPRGHGPKVNTFSVPWKKPKHTVAPCHLHFVKSSLASTQLHPSIAANSPTFPTICQVKRNMVSKVSKHAREQV